MVTINSEYKWQFNNEQGSFILKFCTALKGNNLSI